ncbi:hypothetical protein HYU09_04175 [Candidatus Woesearchaeota archaeon]|nr:hypothetical protein [Candidatus Woesearchaeota archaeon]
MRYINYIIKGLNPGKFYQISSLSIKDYFKLYNKTYPNETHMKAAMDWLSYAQEQNNDGGVSALYSLFDGWSYSYVETTGYIIPTFFNYAHFSKNPVYRQKAVEMADFELNFQLSSGAFPGAGKKDTPIVFNTGQVIFGLCRAYEETKSKKYREAAVKAADWLLSVMDKDGCWRKNEYLGHMHTYNSRTAWAILLAHKISKKGSYKKAAEKNIVWALTQQQENGWFQNNGFYPGQEPLVHTIAYSIRGILESGLYLKKTAYVKAAEKAALALAGRQRNDGSLPGSFDKDWKSSVKWSCLTGNSQMSIIWQKLFIETKDERFIDAAKKSNNYMKKVQNLSSSNKAIRGGIPGAFPIYGWYAPFCFPNWAAKFFIDALLLEANPGMHMKII